MERGPVRDVAWVALLGASLVAATAPSPWPARGDERHLEAGPWERQCTPWRAHHRGRLGLEVQPLTGPLRDFFQVPRDRGVLVARVDPESPAARAGIHAGDVILAAGGEPVTVPQDLVAIVAAAPEDETLELEIARRGERRRVKLVPEGVALEGSSPPALRECLRHRIAEGRQDLLQRLEAIERALREIERRLDRLQAQPPAPSRQGGVPSAPPLSARSAHRPAAGG